MDSTTLLNSSSSNLRMAHFQLFITQVQMILFLFRFDQPRTKPKQKQKLCLKGRLGCFLGIFRTKLSLGSGMFFMRPLVSNSFFFQRTHPWGSHDTISTHKWLNVTDVDGSGMMCYFTWTVMWILYSLYVFCDYPWGILMRHTVPEPPQQTPFNWTEQPDPPLRSTSELISLLIPNLPFILQHSLLFFLVLQSCVALLLQEMFPRCLSVCFCVSQC